MARMSQMVECRVGGDTARPRTEIAGRIESLSRFVDAPERFHGEILGNAAVTDDANSPGVDFLLVRSKQRFEGFKVARREPFQQFHLPLSIPTYWFSAPMVTVFFRFRPFPFMGGNSSWWRAERKTKRRRPGRSTRPGPLVSDEPKSVDVVLLPVKRGVGLDDDVLVRGLLEFVDEHGLAGLQSFRDFWIYADRKVRAFMIGGGHLPRFGLDFVAERRNGLDHAGASAVRAGLAEDALERLLGTLAGDADEAELVEGKRL